MSRLSRTSSGCSSGVRRMARRSTKTIGVLLPIMAAIVGWWVVIRPSPVDRAHELCAECGLSDAEVDQLIDDAKHSMLSREENMRLFLDTFADPAEAELCRTCAEAVLDAAEPELRSDNLPVQSNVEPGR